MRPHLVTLRADEPSPFVPKPRGFGEGNKKNAKPDDEKKDAPKTASKKAKREKREDRSRIEIDLDGIADRVVAFPMPEGRYSQVGRHPRTRCSSEHAGPRDAR